TTVRSRFLSARLGRPGAIAGDILYGAQEIADFLGGPLGRLRPRHRARTEDDASRKSTEQRDDNYRSSKGLRSNSLTGSLAPRRRRPPRRPQHSLPCFMHSGAQRPWQLTHTSVHRVRKAFAVWDP